MYAESEAPNRAWVADITYLPRREGWSQLLFIAGLIAIGLALGIEFKIVELKGDLSKRWRIGAFSIGLALIATSVVLYTRSSTHQTTTAVPTAVPATAAQIQVGLVVQPPAPATASIVPANTGSGAQAPPAPVPSSPLPVATTAASDDAVADFRTLLAAAIADGRVSRDGADMLKKLEELQDALAKGDQKPAGDRLRDLQKRLEDGVRKQTVDPAIAQQGVAVLQRVATQYHLPSPDAKP
jgi:hypothetical protein